ADAPYHAAHDLAVGGLGVEDAPGRDRADDAGHADDADFLVDLDLGEDRRMRVARIRLRILKAHGAFPLDAVDRAMTHGIRDRHGAPGRLVHDGAVEENDVLRL